MKKITDHATVRMVEHYNNADKVEAANALREQMSHRSQLSRLLKSSNYKGLSGARAYLIRASNPSPLRPRGTPFGIRFRRCSPILVTRDIANDERVAGEHEEILENCKW